MKFIITEKQHRRLIESEDPKILDIPSLSIFGGSWNLLQNYLEKKGNPLYSIDGDLILVAYRITSLGNLVSVGGELNAAYSDITSLGNLESVGGDLDLSDSKTTSLGNLKYVGGDVFLNKYLSLIYPGAELRKIVDIRGNIYYPPSLI